MIASNSPTVYSTNIFTIVVSGSYDTTGTYDNYNRGTWPSSGLNEYHDQRTTLRLAADRKVDLRSFSAQIKMWLARAAERARVRWILQQQTLYARRLEPSPETPPRTRRGRVASGSSRYRVMFY